MTEYSGRGDARRTLSLLWGVDEQPNRGPKRRLTVREIVATAVRIADAEGLDAVSMRRIAQELDVGTMSLYRYVANKHELLDLMFDTVCGESALLTDPLPEGWRAKLQLLALSDYAFYHRHPWVLLVGTSRPPFGPNVLTGYEASLAAVADTGLTEKEMVAAIDLIDSYVRGAAQTSVAAHQAEQTTGISDEQWWTEQAPVMDELVDWDRFPTLAQINETGVWEEYDLWDGAEYGRPSFTFTFGLDRILDGLEALIAGRQA